jgi:CBS domain-containing protein
VWVDESGHFAGVVTRAQLEGTPEAERSRTTIQTPPTFCDSAADAGAIALDDALEQLADRGVPWLPVVVDDNVVGGLGVRDAVGTYKSTLPRSARCGTRTCPATSSG